MLTIATNTTLINVRALTKMREGILYMLIGWFLLMLSLILMFTAVFVSIGMHVRPHYISPYITWLPTLLWVAIPSLIFVAAGGTLTLVGLYGKFIPSVSELATSNPNFSTPSTLIKLGYLWGIVLLVVSVVLTPITYGMSLIPFFLSIILIILGHVGMATLCLKLNDVEKNTLYLIAGILFIASILIPILIVISLIILYIALSDSLRKHLEHKTQ